MRTNARPSLRAPAQGFIYLAALLAIAVLGLGLAATGPVWHTVSARAKETELLWVGDHYRRAIERYYQSGPAQYPRRLEDLLEDPRKQELARYLRKLYPDPMSGSDRWGIVKAPDGGIMGVYSLSADEPLRKAGFPDADTEFKDARTYRDWRFVYLAPQQPQASGRAGPG